MAHVMGFVVAINKENSAGSGQVNVLLDVIVEGQTPTDPYRTEALVNLSALPSTVNNALINACVDKAEAEGFTVGVLDQKSLIAGCVGLV